MAGKVFFSRVDVAGRVHRAPSLTERLTIAMNDDDELSALDCTPGMRHANFCDRLGLSP
jgi:hypothetical protein